MNKIPPPAAGGFEMTPDGKVGARIQVRGYTDNYTRATLNLGDNALVLVAVPTPAYEASTEVQRMIIELTRELVAVVVADAAPGTVVERTHVVAPGAALDDPTH